MPKERRKTNGTEAVRWGRRRTDRAGTDFKILYRKLEHALARIERIENIGGTLSQILEILVGEFRDELGFESGRVYERDGDDFVLCCAHGMPPDVPIGFRVTSDYPPQRRLMTEGIILYHPGDPGYDSQYEQRLGITSTFAAITLGEGNTHVLSLTVQGGLHDDRYVFYALSAVRHVINLKLQQQKFSSVLEEARRIQQSLLPAGPPRFADYDIDGRSRPAEEVGGDLYDYLEITTRQLGVAIADASGHGLPAALIARDVITGLRTGLTEDLKVIRTVERLNRVIHRAALTSKFISLFYGEFEPDGYLVYCNAGHNPGLLQQGRAFIELRTGGMVLGPDPDAHYQSGYVRLEAGDRLFLYTDGLVDAESPAGVAFGLNRLKRALRAHAELPSRELVAAVFAELDRFTQNRPQHDDITAVAIRKT
jgi:sigma-B regulation protein RsbU (phosphoserine phosphatase)